MSIDDAVRALESVIDPELAADIVGLGLVYGLAVEDGEVRAEVTSTYPGCPFSEVIRSASEAALANAFPDWSVEVELAVEPPWAPEMATEAALATAGFDRG